MNDQAAESPTRDGPDNTQLLQTTSALPIVQTYCVEEAVPKGNKFERYGGRKALFVAESHKGIGLSSAPGGEEASGQAG